jgi:chromosomal replication initiation ATPase DnaA
MKLKNRFDEITKEISDHTSVKVKDIFSDRRIKPIADARHLLLYILNKEGFTHSYIGMFLEEEGATRHHTSITHGINKATDMVKKRKDMQAIVHEICGD